MRDHEQALDTIAREELGVDPDELGGSLVTGRSILYSGTRQLLFGIAAAGVTFAIGSLINATVA
jgi:hypothetical protein